MTKFNVFDIAIAPFPFSDLNTKKQRPILILSRVALKSASYLYVCAMITSQISGETIPGDCLLADWKKAGLLHLSKVRLAKLVTLEASLVVKPLGKLTKSDAEQIKSHFKIVFDKLA